MSDLVDAITALHGARAATGAAADPDDLRVRAVLDLALAADAAGGRVALGAGVNATLERLDLHWEADAAAAAGGIGSLLRALRGLPEEVAALEVAAAGARRVGLWAEIDRAGINAGWELDEPRPVPAALALAPAASAAPVAAWAERHGVTTCRRLRRSAAGNAFTALDLGLPGTGPAALRAALELLDGPLRPTDDVLGALTALHPGPLALTVALSRRDGLTRGGLVALAASPALRRALAPAAAAFAAALGDLDPPELRAVRRPAGEDVELRWRLS